MELSICPRLLISIYFYLFILVMGLSLWPYAYQAPRPCSLRAVLSTLSGEDWMLFCRTCRHRFPSTRFQDDHKPGKYPSEQFWLLDFLVSLVIQAFISCYLLINCVKEAGKTKVKVFRTGSSAERRPFLSRRLSMIQRCEM